MADLTENENVQPMHLESADVFAVAGLHKTCNMGSHVDVTFSKSSAHVCAAQGYKEGEMKLVAFNPLVGSAGSPEQCRGSWYATSARNTLEVSHVAQDAGNYNEQRPCGEKGVKDKNKGEEKEKDKEDTVGKKTAEGIVANKPETLQHFVVLFWIAQGTHEEIRDAGCRLCWV